MLPAITVPDCGIVIITLLGVSNTVGTSLMISPLCISLFTIRNGKMISAIG